MEGTVILERKSVEQLGKVPHKQLFTYLKLRELKLGFLLNFGAALMKEGIKRIVNGLAEENLVFRCFEWVYLAHEGAA